MELLLYHSVQWEALGVTLVTPFLEGLRGKKCQSPFLRDSQQRTNSICGFSFLVPERQKLSDSPVAPS